jgi:hypothetical protein
MKTTYNYCKTKREFEKLYSDYIALDVYNINNKDKQWETYFQERQKLVEKYIGKYDYLDKYDELFSIGDVITVHYLDVKLAKIEDIFVVDSSIAWQTEYKIVAKDIKNDKTYHIDSTVCIHHADKNPCETCKYYLNECSENEKWYYHYKCQYYESKPDYKYEEKSKNDNYIRDIMNKYGRNKI